MPDLLIELFSEEIPARMQARAAADLKRLMTDGLVEAGLTYAAAEAFATPRRLTLAVEGLTAESPTRREERKGPRTDAPEQALAWHREGRGAVLFAQFLAFFVGDHRQVVVMGHGQSEDVLQEDLPRCGIQQVGAAHHMGDALERVVHDHGQLVGEKAVLAQEHEIRE